MSYNLQYLSETLTKIIGCPVVMVADNNVAQFRVKFSLPYNEWHELMVSKAVDDAWEKNR